MGYNSARGYGYGISNSSSTETILSNNGVIIGNALADGTKNSINLGYGDGVSFAYGIYDSKSTTTDVTNNGIILVKSSGIGAEAKGGTGVGYQYTSAEAERNVINRYDSFKGEEKYNLNSFNAFIEGKYSYDIGDNTKLEPKVKLSYYYVSQDKIDEGYNNKNITMEVDKAHSNTADLEVGVDLVKSKVLEKGKLKGIVSLGVVNTLGDHSKELKGKIKGANKLGKEFDLQGVELPRTSGKVGLNLEYERVNGMIYTAGIDFEFAKDYNRNVSLQVGVGYRF